MSLYMGDITDLFVTNSRTRVSPQKSYVDSYLVTGATADTGVTLSVANNQWYVVVFQTTFQNAGVVTLTATLLQGATTKQTISISSNNTTTYSVSGIYQNTSGSTQTVKLQASYSGPAAPTMNLIGLISGSFVVSTPSLTFGLNAYINNFEMVGVTNNLASGAVINALTLNQTYNITTTSIVLNYNQTMTSIPISGGNYTAFDFDGNTLVAA